MASKSHLVGIYTETDICIFLKTTYHAGKLYGPRYQDHLQIEVLTSSIELGEGPHWDHERGILYYINLYDSEVHSYEPATREHRFIKIGNQPVTFIVPLVGKKGKFAISCGCDLHILTWDGKSSTFSTEHYCNIESRSDSRLNDAKASPSNVLFAGSMGCEHGTFIPDGEGSLYAISGRNVKLLIDGIGISNGLAWNADETEFYWNDTLASKVYKFNYDRHSCTLSNQRVLLDFKERNIPGLPDGMTMDSDGHLWIACIKGSQIIKVCPKSGEVLRIIEVPCTDITSLAFGGPNFDMLYCTTSTHNVDANDISPEAGCLLKITGLGVCGVPAHLAKL